MSSWLRQRVPALRFAQCSSRDVALTLPTQSITMQQVVLSTAHLLSASASAQDICSRPHSSARPHLTSQASAVLSWAQFRVCSLHSMRFSARTVTRRQRLSTRQLKNLPSLLCHSLHRKVWTGCMQTALQQHSAEPLTGWVRSTMPASLSYRSCTNL